MRIKSVYRKNLKMTPEKMASQVAHAVKGLGINDTECSVIVLGVSDRKFDELVSQNNCYIQRDRGLTQVAPGSSTAAAWVELPSDPLNVKVIPNEQSDIDSHMLGGYKLFNDKNN